MNLEETDISFKDVSKQHENLIKRFQLPRWIIEQNCTKCNKTLGYLSIRSIGVKINAQHIGNFFIEVCCIHCKYGYELHIKRICSNIGDFINLLTNACFHAKMEPDYLIPNNENNLVQNIVRDIKENKNGNTQTQ